MKKLNLIPLHQLGANVPKANGAYATFSPKTGHLLFSREYIIQKGLANRFLRFYADQEKKVLAWSPIVDKELTGWKKPKQIRNYTGSYVCTIPAETLRTFLGLTQTETFKKMPIQTYKDGNLIGEVDFIELIQKPADKHDEI